jgi:hypothetical protein
MLGYIISDKSQINVKNYEIQSFDILNKTNLNIFVIKNNKVLYKNDIINNASSRGNIQVLEWFKISGYKFKYNKQGIYWAYEYKQIKILKFFSNNINIKKLINLSSSNIFIKTITFKTKTKYLKGYKKN